MYHLVNFIPEHLLILVAAPYVLRIGCKKYKQLDNKYIPAVLLILDTFFSVMLELNATEFYKV